MTTATNRGIAVANMPGAKAPSVAEGTVLLMLAALRRLPTLDTAIRQGRGRPTDPELGETIRDIGGCTVGLIGYGNIAKRVAAIVAAMGATVLHTSTPDDGRPGRRPLPQLLAASDIVSVHVPLTTDTEHLIYTAALARMNPDSVLVNTSRGAVIDEDALVPTPHVTWYTADTMRRYLTEAVQNCRRLRDGRPLANLVNQPTGC